MKQSLLIKIFSGIILLAIAGGVSYYIYNLFPHYPSAEVMTIHSDNDFEKYNLPGSGVIGDPYTIEEYDLGLYEYNEVKDKFIGLQITDTTKHFVVRNCSFTGGKNTIYFKNLAPGTATIENCEFYSIPQTVEIFEIGINSMKIVNSSDVVISKCDFLTRTSKIGGYAIELQSSDNCIIMNNYCQNYYTGFAVYYSNNVTIRDNIFQEIGAGASVVFYNSNYAKVLDNFIYDCSLGVWLTSCDFPVIENNRIETIYVSATMSGIEMEDCNSARIVNNTIIRYWFGIFMHECSLNLIMLNLIQNCQGYGVSLSYDVFNCTVFHNTFKDNNQYNLSTSQAFDNSTWSLWYSPIINEGNFWNDLGTNSTYNISGPSNSIDLYPLNEPII
jgi:parallel beta-helix repeat protein